MKRRLKRLVPTWFLTPGRRLAQTACLAAFAGLLFYVAFPYTARPGSTTDGWPSHYIDDLREKEAVPAETFLLLDPLVGIAAAVASRSWTWPLAVAAAMLALGVLIPRVFCSYVCPLGSLVDLFDWAVGRPFRRLVGRRRRTDSRPWWRYLRFGMLAAVLAAAALGVVLTGFLAAIPLVSRAMVFLIGPLQTAAVRGWHQVPPWTAAQGITAALFATVLGLGLLGRRFWCRCLCPTGAAFSLAGSLRATRKVDRRCKQCGKCIDVCPFDAIHPDISTRTADCAHCRTCGAVCPTHSIQFGVFGLDDEDDDDSPQAPVEPREPRAGSATRRDFLSAAASAAVGALAGAGTAVAASPAALGPVRPPGSLPEPLFLARCVRCGACLRACPNDALQPVGLSGPGLWTPQLAADWSGCEPSCSNCGQVCPTGAIRPLPIDEKRRARMGLAVVDLQTCFPHAGTKECRLCKDDCDSAGYAAIEFQPVHFQTDASGVPLDGTGFFAPRVLAERCVGCGICQSRCHAAYVVKDKTLAIAAIRVETGPDKEDRLVEGSYRALREQEEERRREEQRKLIEASGGDSGFSTDF